MSLKEQAVKGVKWASIATGWCTLVQWGQLVIVTRLLKPEDFGLLAMAMVVIGFAQLIGDLGISAAIVQKKEITRNQLSSTYWLNILFGVILFFVIAGISPVVAHFFKEPKLTKIIILVSLTFLIAPWGTQFQLLFQKELKFNVLAKRDMVTSTVQFVVTIVAAFYGMKVYSLVLGQLFSLVVNIVYLVLLSPREWKPKRRFKFEDLKGFVSFGLFQLGERGINYLNMQFDRLFIGKVLGVMQVGYYNVAMNFTMQPINKINPMLTNIAFPVFSKVQEDTIKLQSGYTRLLKIVSSINSPMLIGFSAVASSAVPIVFGEQWKSSVGLFQLLSIYSLIRSLCNPAGSLILAKGRADMGFKWNFVLFWLSPVVIILGYRINGITGIAYSLIIWQMMQLFGIYIYMVKRLVGNCFPAYFDGAFRPMLFSAIMGIGVWQLTIRLQNTITSLIIEVLTGAILYALLYLLFDRVMVKQLWTVIVNSMRKLK